jgi:hypothetical protein
LRSRLCFDIASDESSDCKTGMSFGVRVIELQDLLIKVSREDLGIE